VGPTRLANNGPVALAYDLRGRGAPLVLIQGVGVGRWGWEPVAARLARRFQVITIDNRLGRQRRITQPTLIVQGTADQVVDPGTADVLAGLLPNARVQWFEGAGHLLYWEGPKRFVRAVTDFLTDPAAAASVPTAA
jgi:pimeloyl-ACP methyl ester carboxylesterase